MKAKTWIKRLQITTLALLATGFLTTHSFGSDPIGIYSVIDRVLLEPSEAAPERIQIWGSFSFAEGRGQTYAAPVAGYVFYKLPAEKKEAALKEWSDLRQVAGKVEVVGFGTRWGEKGKVRKGTEKPGEPDIYPLGFGLQKIRRLEYEPVKNLLAFHKARQEGGQKVSSAAGAFPREVILCTGNKTTRGREKAELEKGFSLGPDEFILSGGESPADLIIVDDDLTVNIGDRKVFVDDDGCRSNETRPEWNRVYDGTPLLLQVGTEEKIVVMATDRGQSGAVVGELYLHGRDGLRLKITDRIEQASASQLPNTFFTREITPTKLTAGR